VTVACVLALALYAALHLRRSKQRFVRQSAWTMALGNRPAGKVPWMGLQLEDGRLIEGQLFSYSTDLAEGNRDIALATPIFVTTPQGKKLVSPLERVVFSEEKISHVGLVFLDAPKED
jgi:hypothetical protein